MNDPTPTPWTHIADANLECRHLIALDPEEPGCAEMIGNIIKPSNAALIAHRVNVHDALVKALERIANWEMPATGRHWDDGTPVSYGVEFGSNGERNIIVKLAQEAIAEAVQR